MLLELLHGTVKEAMRLKVSCAEGQEVNSCQAGLLARRCKHNHGLFGRVLADGSVHWLHHGHQAGGGVGHGEALDVQLQRHRPHVGVEVEERVCGGAKPLT